MSDESRPTHTPGPWHWTADSGSDAFHRNDYRRIPKVVNECGDIAWVMEGSPYGTAAANARLMAAAPDLLDACRAARDAIERLWSEEHRIEPTFVRLEAAIARAERGEPYRSTHP